MASREMFQMPDQLPQISPTLVRSYPRYRYDTVRRFINGNPDKLLDVGGFTHNPVLKDLFPNTFAISVNVNDYHIPKRYGDLTYDGVRLPLPSGCVPVAIAVDVFAHVEDAPGLLKEMVRVANDQVIVSGPYHSAANTEWENNLLTAMEEAGLPPKASIKRHREKDSLPTLQSLVAMARQTGYPFHIHPATISAMEFMGLLNQVEVYKQMGVNPDSIKMARAIAANTESLMEQAPRPIWPDAYRAVLVIDVSPKGRIITNGNELYYSLDEATAYGRAFARAGWGEAVDGISRCQENPLSGFCIGFEGQDGTGKTVMIEILSQIFADYGYTVAKPSRLGPRKNFRDFEKAHGMLTNPLIREIFLAEATIQSAVAGNAHALLGPCNIAFLDRTAASVDVYHRTKGIQKPIEAALTNIPKKPPFMTILLEIDSEEDNWNRMRQGQDPANMKITRQELHEQRNRFGELTSSAYTGPLYRINNSGPLEGTIEKILQLFEEKCLIRFCNRLSREDIRKYIEWVVPNC